MAPPRGAPTSSPTPIGSTSHGHIHGLDGLRALAIIGVLVFHLRALSLPGGYLGVDVFFVISGFLITTLLIRELRKNHRLNLKAFWTRRARRLIPALVTVVLVSVALALLAGNDLLVNIERQVVGALTFSNNWLEIAAGSSYFNATSPQLFVNFWSLAVEEQFYLLWPLVFTVVMATTRTGRQRVGILLGLAATSAVLMAVLFTPGQDATRVYYGTDTHAFGLMIGAALALSAAGESANIFAWRWYLRSRVLLAMAGVAGLIVLMTTLTPDSAFAYRGGIVLASVCTALIIGAFPGPKNFVQMFFDLRPLVWLGQRSYGVYMWHWPVILLLAAFGPAVSPDSVGSWIQRGAAVVLSIALAAASYRWIENPIRTHGFGGVARQIWDRLRAPGRFTPARIGAAGAAVCVGMFTVAVATAPDRSQVEIAMDQASGLVNVGPVAASGQDGGGTTQQDADTGSADTEQSGDSDGQQDDTEQAADAQESKDDSAQEDDAAQEDESSGQDEEAQQEESAEQNEEDGATDPPADGLPSGEDISAFGDSMLYVAAPALSKEYPGIDIDAVSNRQWPDVQQAVDEAVAADTVRDVVVIAAGTNAGVTDEQVVRDTLDALGPDRQIVLVNIYGASYWVPEANQTLSDIAADYPNAVVADWQDAAEEHPDQLQPDAIHPDMDGMYLYADVVTKALQTLDT